MINDRFDEIINRCLGKEVGRRYKNSLELFSVISNSVENLQNIQQIYEVDDITNELKDVDSDTYKRIMFGVKQMFTDTNPYSIKIENNENDNQEEKP